MTSSAALRTALAVTGFLFVAGFFLATEHRAHVFGLLPFLLILACPLLHVFLHRGHGSGHSPDGGHPDGGRPDGRNSDRVAVAPADQSVVDARRSNSPPHHSSPSEAS